MSSQSAGRFLAILAFCGVLFAVPQPVALAHDVSQSDARIEVEGSRVRVVLTLNAAELRPAAATSGEVYGRVKEHYSVRGSWSGGDYRRPEEMRLENVAYPGGSLVRLEIGYRFAYTPAAVEVTSMLYEVMPGGHQHLLSVALGGSLHEAVLDSRTKTVRFTGTATDRLQTVWRFVRLGIEHIFTGYDHLAFLAALLVATRTAGSLVKIVTSFTIAHSLTLALATFGVVALPPRLTEPLIALSILYVAVENLLDFRAMKRYWITFFFGLIHGFGFSGVLRGMDLPRSSLALSLFSFNAGVEVGQLTFVLLLFPLMQELASSERNRLKFVLSTAIACLAAYWFVRRTFLS